MSSFRMRMQLKLLSFLRGDTSSDNEHFDNAHTLFKEMHRSIMELEAAIRGFSSSLGNFHSSGQVLSGSIARMGSMMDPSSGMEQTIDDLQLIYDRVDEVTRGKMIERFEEDVQGPATQWMERAAAIKCEIAKCNEKKLYYDHYTAKLRKLYDARAKRTEARKEDTEDQAARITQNEKKYNTARAEYLAAEETTLRSLDEFLYKRDAMLERIVKQLADFRYAYAANVFIESRSYNAIRAIPAAADPATAAVEESASKPDASKPAVKQTETIAATPSSETELYEGKAVTSPGSVAIVTPHSMVSAPMVSATA